MEKRMFLALFLSLIVIVTFQSIYGQKVQKLDGVKPQAIAVESFTDKQTVGSVKAADQQLEAAATSSFAEEVLFLENASLKIELSTRGGSVKTVEIKDLRYDLPVRDFANLKLFSNKEFKIQSSNGKEALFVYDSGEWRVERKYWLDSKRSFHCLLRVKNTTNASSLINDNLQAFVIDMSRLDKITQQSDWTLHEYSIKTNNRVIRKNNVVRLNDKWNKEESVKVDWFGFRDRYFATIIQPEFDVQHYAVQVLSAESLQISSPVVQSSFAPGQEREFSFIVYAGPQRPEELKSAKPGFESIMAFSDWGWLDAISKAMYWLLGSIHKIIPVWGLCIILISLFIYTLMYPLTIKSLTSMKKMQTIQPKVKELQEKYKKSPEKLNQEIMELYKKNGVNPLGGCLPMLLQMPIFVGLYQVLWRSIYFRGEGFLWIKDLSMPDRLFKLPVNLPIIGEYFNILPILMMGTMALQQKFTSKNMVVTDDQQAQQQKMMATMMPIMIGFIFYNFSSGLNLYFVVFYLLSAFTQWKISQDNA